MKITKAPAPREIIDYFKEEFDLEFEVMEMYSYGENATEPVKMVVISLPNNARTPIYGSGGLYINITIEAYTINSGLARLARDLSYNTIKVNGAEYQVPFLIHTKNVEL